MDKKQNHNKLNDSLQSIRSHSDRINQVEAELSKMSRSIKKQIKAFYNRIQKAKEGDL